MQDERNRQDPISFVADRQYSFAVYGCYRHAHPAKRGKGYQGHMEILKNLMKGSMISRASSRIILIYAFHHCLSFQLTVAPFLDTIPRGVLPPVNPVAQILLIVDQAIYGSKRYDAGRVEDVDIFDGTPLLDLKPFVPAFDSYPDTSSG